jgi:cytoskeleton protein RodZ
MELLGAYLKSQREKRGIRLEEIASITKIHLHNLQLLERSAWDELPPEPFIRGFILAYAKYVGLESRDIIDRYQNEVGVQTAELALPQFTPPTPTQGTATAKPDFDNVVPEPPQEDGVPEKLMASSPGFPMKKIALGGGAGAVLLLIFGLMMVGKQAEKPASQENSDKVAASQPAPEPASAPSTPAIPTKVEVVTPPSQPAVPDRKVAEAAPDAPVVEIPPRDPETQHQIVVFSREKSWMKVIVDEEAPQQFIAKKGEKLVYNAKSKVKLVIGFSPGLDVYHNGEIAKGKQFQGTIRFYIWPKGARFPQDKPAQRDTANDAAATPATPLDESKPATENEPPSE